jgi:hypothetical protein
MQLNKKYIGVVVSQDTLRPEELIPTFEAFLGKVGGAYYRRLARGKERPEAVAKLLDVGGCSLTRGELDEVGCYLQLLMDCIECMAPNDCYFGVHESGCDDTLFAFWLDEEGNH